MRNRDACNEKRFQFIAEQAARNDRGSDARGSAREQGLSLVGDGTLPHPGLEKILETYYNYSLTSSTKLTADYPFFGNPGYNTERGPVNVFTGRFHWQF
ncbi:MAG: carbohydrate porin [Rhodomicrobium sp.]